MRCVLLRSAPAWLSLLKSAHGCLAVLLQPVSSRAGARAGTQSNVQRGLMCK